MKFTKALCYNCFNPNVEFEKWSPDEKYKGFSPFNGTTPERRKEFWEYADANLKKDCIILGLEDYPSCYCYECCKSFMEAWAEKLDIPSYKIFD